MKVFVVEKNVSKMQDDADAEMRRLKLELQRTMEMYSTACKQATTSMQKVRNTVEYPVDSIGFSRKYFGITSCIVFKAAELHKWRAEEERRLEEARLAEESARLKAEQEKAKFRAAMENVGAAQRLADMESQRRVSAEMKAMKESDETDKAISKTGAALNYRRYTIDEIEEATKYFSKSLKVGEGGYGPVFKCHLDHTPVAVKVLRPDAAQGRSQFQQEVRT